MITCSFIFILLDLTSPSFLPFEKRSRSIIYTGRLRIARNRALRQSSARFLTIFLIRSDKPIKLFSFVFKSNLGEREKNHEFIHLLERRKEAGGDDLLSNGTLHLLVLLFLRKADQNRAIFLRFKLDFSFPSDFRVPASYFPSCESQKGVQIELPPFKCP